METPDTGKARSRWRRLLLWLGLPLLLLLAALAGVYYYVLTNARRDLQAAIGEIERRDPRWRLHEIEEDRAIIPEHQNSALTVLAAQKLLPAGWPPISAALNAEGVEEDPLVDRLDSVLPEQVLDPKLHRELRAELQKLEPALVEALKLTNQTRGRYPMAWSRDYWSTPWPGADAYPVVILLRMEALLRAQEKDLDGALALVHAVLSVGRSIGDEPSVITQLARSGYQITAAGIVERVLAQGQPSEPELMALQRALEGEAAQPLLRHAARGERAGMYETLGLVETGEVRFSKLVSDFGGSPPDWASTVSDYAARGQAVKARAWHLRYMTDFADIAQLPVHEGAPRLQELNARRSDAPDLLKPMLLNTSRVAGGLQRAQAMLHTAIAALAIERYRLANGRWPESLDALVGKQLRVVPLDPYDGKPLRYHQLTDGAEVNTSLSRPKNQQGSRHRIGPSPDDPDLSFRLWDVARRRQAPNKAGVSAKPVAPG